MQSLLDTSVPDTDRECDKLHCIKCMALANDIASSCTIDAIIGITYEDLLELELEQVLVMLGALNYYKAIYNSRVIFSESTIELPSGSYDGRMKLKLIQHGIVKGKTLTGGIINTYSVNTRFSDKRCTSFDTMVKMIGVFDTLEYDSYISFYDNYAELCADILGESVQDFRDACRSWKCEVEW